MTPIPTPRMLPAGCDTDEPPSHLQVTYLKQEELSSFLHSAPALEPMAVVAFGQPLPYNVPCPVLVPALPPIDAPSLVEVWFSNRKVRTSVNGGLSAAMNSEWLIGFISLEERPGRSLESLTYDAYQEILLCLNGSGYPHLCRIWNYFPRINEDQDGLERYRRFCIGRHRALAQSLPGFPFSLPAATAVGTRSGPLQIMVLASTKPAIHLGNPRQTNAYEYPPKYGPRSPSFARATLLQSECDRILFIAGTASVVGHASRHIGRPADQTHESIRNVMAILQKADSVCGADFLSASTRATYKVYVRHLDLLLDIRNALHESALPSRSALFLQGDLCRKELLMEIEGAIISQ
ncbi:MAG: hypothetical protein NZM29_01165 [Nitrospira sp.]|nr:hypothetical protein [Nitrospira sp.]